MSDSDAGDYDVLTFVKARRSVSHFNCFFKTKKCYKIKKHLSYDHPVNMSCTYFYIILFSYVTDLYPHTAMMTGTTGQRCFGF